MFLGKPSIVQNKYERLPGTPREARTGTPRLFAGPNHLLWLKLTGHREIARRFYYADISAIQCKVTWTGYVLNAMGLIVLVAAWITYLPAPFADTYAALVSMIAGTVLFGSPVLLSLLRGPTCKTWLHTTNHTERLPSLRRYREAQRAIANIHERIRAVQGSLADAEESESLPPFAPPVPDPAPLQNPAIRQHKPKWMVIFFGIALILAALSIIEMLLQSPVLEALSTWIMFVVAVLGPVVIAQSYHTNCPPPARRMAACIVILPILALPVAIVMLALLAFAGANMDAVTAFPYTTHGLGPAYLVMAIFEGGWLLINAVCGWRGLAASKRAPEQPKEP